MAIKGIVLITRHGDRMGFYQSPTTYTAISTNLTVLGYQQEYQNGQDLRTTYLTSEGDLAIQGINATKAEGNQLRVMADAAGEGSVIVDSTNALLQGLFPAYNDVIQLANGDFVSWNRTQLIEVETIEADQQVWLEGWTQCREWTDRLDKWYESTEFKNQATLANTFYASLKDVLGDRPATLENAWNLFDFLNVESIHNATISRQVSAAQLQQAAYWANYHESGSFSDPDLDNVGNVAGQAILTPLLDALNDIQNATDPLKLAYLSASYKPFISLFNMWGLPELSNSVVSYASAAVLEIDSDDTIHLKFRNGTDGEFEEYPLLNGSTPKVSDFVLKMQPYALSDLANWCNKCGTSDARGCEPLAALNGTGGAGYASIDSTQGRHHVSPVVAGVIGSMVTLAVTAFALALWLLLGGLVKKNRRTIRSDGSSVGTRHGSDHGLDAKESS